MKKELNIMSMEGEVLLKDNLVRSAILPHNASELNRDVNILVFHCEDIGDMGVLNNKVCAFVPPCCGKQIIHRLTLSLY